MYPAVSYQDLRNSNPALSSGNVEENLSLYWHPSVYQVEADGTRRLAEMGMTTAYYTWESGSGVRAFPNDFRMIGGLDPSVAQVEVSCVDSSPCQRGAACSSPSTFFPASACTELEVSMSFPRCWDGSQKTTLDQSHVIYVGPVSIAFVTNPRHYQLSHTVDRLAIRMNLALRLIASCSLKLTFSFASLTILVGITSSRMGQISSTQTIFPGGTRTFFRMYLTIAVTWTKQPYARRHLLRFATVCATMVMGTSSNGICR